MSKPTPTPWEAKDYMVSNYPSEPFTVICYTANNAKSRTPENLANAAFIVRAVNSHDELRASLQDWLYLAAVHFPEFCDTDAPDCDPEDGLCCDQCKAVGCIQLKIRNARAALAKGATR